MHIALGSIPSELLSSKQQASSGFPSPSPHLPTEPLSSPVVRFLAGLLDTSVPSTGKRLFVGGSSSTHMLAVWCNRAALPWLEGQKLSYKATFFHPLPGLSVTTWWCQSRTAWPPEASLAGLGSCLSFLVCPDSKSCVLPLSLLAWLCPSPGLSFTLLSHKVLPPKCPVVLTQPKLTSDPRPEGRRLLVTAGPGPGREGNWQQGAMEANAETAFAGFATRWPGKARDCLLASASLPLKWGCFCRSSCVLGEKCNCKEESERNIQEKHGWRRYKERLITWFYNFYCLKYGGNPRLERPPSYLGAGVQPAV